MDLDINQVFVYILNSPLFVVVDSIRFLYTVAARTRDEKIRAVLIAVAKEFMTLMHLFQHPQDWDYRPIQDYCWTRYLSIDSFSQIARHSLVLRLACSYAAASTSAAADIITELVEYMTTMNDKKKIKNDLRYLTQYLRRISQGFQCVAEMLFRDRPNNATTDIVRRFILQSIRPWLPYFPPCHDPRNATDLIFNGVLSLDMLNEISLAVSDLQDAVMLTRYFVLSSKGSSKVEVDLASNVLTDMIIVQCMLEYHFPSIIQPSSSTLEEVGTVQESNNKHFHSQEEEAALLIMMLSDALDIVTMCGVVIESLQQHRAQFLHLLRVFGCLLPQLLLIPLHVFLD